MVGNAHPTNQLLRFAGPLQPAHSRKDRAMSAIQELGDKIAGLTIAQAVELKNYLKEKYQIEPAGGGVMIAPGAGGGGAAAPAAPAAEPTEFNVVLEAGFDAAKKIQIIKVVREITGQGLAEAKATVEGAPKNIKEGVDKKTAEDLKKKIEESGAKVSIKPA
jgi:large subunit ribosomal protein L7/L12